MKTRTDKTLYIVVAAAILIIGGWLAPALGIDAEKSRGMALLAASLLLWITEALPMCISVLAMICVLPIFGIMSFDEAMGAIGVNTALFIMASSGITVALSDSSVPELILNRIFIRMKDRPYIIVILTGLSAALFSAFMSSLAVCVLYTGIIGSFLEKNDMKTRSCALGRALMMSIPACAGIGGFMSPAGTPGNILIMDLLARSGYQITFTQWCVIGFPAGVVTALLFLMCTVLIFKPAKPEFTHIEDDKKSLTGKDRLIITIILLIIAGWFLSGWIESFNITIVSIF